MFLGIDHNWTENGPPLLFETMVFGDDAELTQRYSTYDQAEAGHKATVERLRSEEKS